MNLSSSFKRRESTQEVDQIAPPQLKNVLPSYSSQKYLNAAVSATACKAAESRSPPFEVTTRSEDLQIAAQHVGRVEKKRAGSVNSPEWSAKQLPVKW